MINDSAWDYIVRIKGWDAILDHERTISTYETAVFQWKWLKHRNGQWVLVECMTAIVGSTMISAVHILPSSYSCESITVKHLVDHSNAITTRTYSHNHDFDRS